MTREATPSSLLLSLTDGRRGGSSHIRRGKSLHDLSARVHVQARAMHVLYENLLLTFDWNSSDFRKLQGNIGKWKDIGVIANIL